MGREDTSFQQVTDENALSNRIYEQSETEFKIAFGIFTYGGDDDDDEEGMLSPEELAPYAYFSVTLSRDAKEKYKELEDIELSFDVCENVD